MSLADIVFRTTDMLRWGVGKGSPLSSLEGDENNWELRQAVQGILDDPPTANQIASITKPTATTMLITLEGGATFGPFTLPVAEFRDRGAYNPATDYLFGDIFTSTTKLVLVLQDHTTAGAFNPTLTQLGNPVYRVLFDASGLTMTFLDAGYPAVGVDLHTFEVFSVPDVGVFLVLQDHEALAAFDADAVGVDTNPLYKKIFNAIETAKARIQYQYPGSFPADESLMWKLIQDDTRDLTIPAAFADSLAHLEDATTTETIVFTFTYGGDEIGTLTFAPGELLDGDGGQFGLFEGDGATIANQELLRMTSPDVADATAKFLTISIVANYAE